MTQPAAPDDGVDWRKIAAHAVTGLSLCHGCELSDFGVTRYLDRHLTGAELDALQEAVDEVRAQP